MGILMYYKQTVALSTLMVILLSGNLYAQDEKTAGEKKSPIVDEFSLVMRNLMKRADVNPNGVSSSTPVHKLDAKVVEIQTLFNKSDAEVFKASEIQSDSLVSQSESLQIQELEKLQAQIEEDEERQVTELLITKAKIASIKKNIRSEKQRLALEKAGEGVDAALRLVEGTKE